jgi:hypothetical protein
VCVCFFFFSSNLIFWVLPRVWLKPIIKTRNMLAADSLSTHTHYIFTGLSHPSVCVCVCVCVRVLCWRLNPAFHFKRSLTQFRQTNDTTTAVDHRNAGIGRPSWTDYLFSFLSFFLFFSSFLLCSVCVCVEEWNG